MRILIADDDRAVRDALRRALELEGHHVEVVEDGQAALEWMDREEPPDLVITDVAMPRIGGIELCELIRRSSNVPVLVLTASADPSTRVAANEAGASVYMTKPYALEDLLAQLGEVAQSRPERTAAALQDEAAEAAPTSPRERTNPAGPPDAGAGTLAAAMAKKPRTPPPPKRVQAPQRRQARKDAAQPRSPWLYAAGGAAVAVIAAVVAGFILTRGNDEASRTGAPSTNYNALPGIRRTKAPWPPEYEFLADRLQPLGLNTLAQEGVATHIHAHLDTFVNGKRTPVPAQIGINPGANYITELHTHDTRGVIHVESPKANDELTLGQFVAEWGVFLNSRCIGAYCKDLKWYVDGKPQTGHPGRTVLKSRQDIAIVAGKPPAQIPSSYEFSPGE